MEPPRTDWSLVLEAIASGDELAFLKLRRLLTCFLSDFGSSAHSSDWDDVIQDVVLKAIAANARGDIRSPSAVVGFLRVATRNRLIDHVRKRRRIADDELADEVPSASESQSFGSRMSSPVHERIDVWNAVEMLPNKERVAVVSVYAEGKTYEETAEETGIPLGSLKRYLRQGLKTLGSALGERYRAA